ncbi:MAG: Methionine aminopeptidase 2, partial [Paramarteilia canceri]
CIENLNGHQIDQYIIHAGKNIPLVKKNSGKSGRMKIGEQYAIETFASTGLGLVKDRGESTHFMMRPEMLNYTHQLNNVNQILDVIKKNHGSLAFCQRFLTRGLPPSVPSDRIDSALKFLLNNKRSEVIREYPPLCDINGCYTSQMEHTLFIRHNSTEILSRGSDY